MVYCRKIKVLHFFGSGFIGGQEKAMYQLFRSFLSDDEFEFGVAMWKGNGYFSTKIRESNTPVIKIDFKSGFDFSITKNKTRKLGNYQIHHFHDPTPNVVLLSIFSGSDIKRAFTRRGGFHNYRQYGLKIIIKYFINKLLIKNFFDGFSGNTLLATEFVRQFYGLRNKKIHLLYNGIYFDELKPTIQKEYMINELNLKPSEFKIGTACHLIPLKRVDLIIKAFKSCKIQEKRLIILGRGSEEHRLQKLVNDLGLERKVLFVGEVPHMQIQNYLKILDCFILASGKEESFGNALVEAMYLKIPSIIMDDSPALKEHVLDNETGLIAKDAYDLSQKIEKVFYNPQESQIIGKKGSDYVITKYSISNMMKAYKNFYRHILRGNN